MVDTLLVELPQQESVTKPMILAWEWPEWCILTGAGANYFLVRDEEGKWIATGPETVANLILSYANIPAGDNLSVEIIDNNI